MKPTKPAEKTTKKKGHVMVVTNHRLGEGTHSAVFPEHAHGENHWHKGSRNGHPGMGTGAAKPTK